MAYKPGRKANGEVDFDRLRTILNQTGTSQKSNPLYQFCNSLLDLLGKEQKVIQAQLTALDTSASSGGSTPTPDEETHDYVVLSDGATPTPSPVNDGFGNFIYIQYEP